MTTAMDDLRYPVGRFTPVLPAAPDIRAAAVEEIAALPARMRAAIEGLSESRLDTPYRPGGWTVRQVVHHVADSHMNGYVRTKLALTEEQPTIKPYDESTWAALPDSRLSVDVSLGLLEGLQERWAVLFRSLSAEQYGRTFIHPELEGAQSLDRQLQSYAWHSRHHVAHITAVRRREGW